MTKPKSRENVLTPDERKLLLEAISNDEEELAIKGLLFTGMRVSEFIHMGREWIDWKEAIIHIPSEMPCRCYECEKDGGKWTAKTKHAQRPIPIVPEVDKLFRTYFEDYKSIMDLLDNRVKVWRLVKTVGMRAGISHKVFPHALRATFATVLVEKGLSDPVMLTQIMGWKKLEMAQAYIRLGGAALKNKVMDLWG